MPLRRRFVSLRTILLVVVMAALAVLLVFQQKRILQEENAWKQAGVQAKEQAEAERRQMLQAMEVKRASALSPLDRPDFMGDPPFTLLGNLERISEKYYQQAAIANPRIQEMKAARARAYSPATPQVPVLVNAKHYQETSAVYKQFRLRELEAYRELTTDQDQTKERGEQFLESYLLMVLFDPQAPPREDVLSLARQVMAPETVDPLLRTYATQLIYEADGDPVSAIESFTQALTDLQGSRYPRVVHLYLRLFAYDLARNVSSMKEERKSALIHTIVRWLEEESRTLDHLAGAHMKLTNMLSNEDDQFYEKVVVGCVNSGLVDPFWVHWLLGCYKHKLARKARGSGWARDVSQKQWDEMYRELKFARIHLEYAWSLRPEFPHPCNAMIDVAMLGGDPEYSEADWFNRAVESQYDFGPA